MLVIMRVLDNKAIRKCLHKRFMVFISFGAKFNAVLFHSLLIINEFSVLGSIHVEIRQYSHDIIRI